MLTRILAGLFIIVGAYLLPWWLVSLFILALLFYYENFYEAIIAGFIMDTIYGGNFLFFEFEYSITLSVFIIFIIVSVFKKRLAMY